MGEEMSEVTFEVPVGEPVSFRGAVGRDSFLVEFDAGKGRVYRVSGRLPGAAPRDGVCE
ncbi:hypothetical protein ABT024_05990 [Streptomyces sp. NPDC002812]|uniref:hypothetical protein n=1 Tax=Streptomyces sp. NPDC002812 TaxID=3154434 RepID=UPI0033217921